MVLSYATYLAHVNQLFIVHSISYEPRLTLVYSAYIQPLSLVNGSLPLYKPLTFGFLEPRTQVVYTQNTPRNYALYITYTAHPYHRSFETLFYIYKTFCPIYTTYQPVCKLSFTLIQTSRSFQSKKSW